MTETTHSSAQTALTIQQIMDIIPHRYPFLLVDCIEIHEPGIRIVGKKNVTINEPYFEGHFPGHPIMPGVLIIESMAQVGVLYIMLNIEDREKVLIYFRRIDRAKFRKPVVPGDCLRSELKFVKRRGVIWVLDAKTTVNDEVVASAELEATAIPKA